jgi:hypothetical protein
VVERKPVPILYGARHGGGRCKVGAEMKSPLISRAGFAFTVGAAVGTEAA